MKQSHKETKKKGNTVLIIIAILFFLAGGSVFLYPAVSNFLAEQHQTQVVQTYDEELSNLTKQEMDKQWALAKEYNENLTGDPVHDPFVLGSGYALPDNYEEVLNMDGVMCYLSIPKINLRLPVYHGTSKEVLEKGIGHLEATALPIGGEGTHAVLTGHRGLPSAELFTNLDKLEVGDYFYIHVLDEVLAYQVDQIKTILPEKLDELSAVEGKDYITLLTCTPYGINTHRLLVRGERTYDAPPEDEVQSGVTVLDRLTDNGGYYLFGILLALSICIVIWFCWIRKRKGSKKHAQ